MIKPENWIIFPGVALFIDGGSGGDYSGENFHRSQGNIMPWLRLLLLVLVVSSAGCEHVLYQRFEKGMWSNYVHLNDLNTGMTKEEVLGIMGPPGIKEAGRLPWRTRCRLFLPDPQHGLRLLQHRPERLYPPGIQRQ